MKKLSTLLGVLVVLFITGCATTDQVVLDSTKRTPTTSVDIYKDAKMPDRRFKEIAELSFLGPREDELRAQKRFTDQAKQMGGNGIIFRIEDTGQKAGFPAYNTPIFVFKGKVIVYE